MVDVLQTGKNTCKSWFHVYLDNFCAMERKDRESTGVSGERLREMLEDVWGKEGVLSSAKKRVSGASQVQELGAAVDGKKGTLGASAERILKLLQLTFVVIGQRRLKRKWVQVLAGRWVHVFSFRRAGMVVFDKVWKFISADYVLGELENKVRSEFLAAVSIALLLHSNLRAGLSSITSASDASMGGGAVGMSSELTLSGAEFAEADKDQKDVVHAPIMVLSLFDGIGCTFRCYDLCGVVPEVAVAAELNKEANRVVARRWPNDAKCVVC